MKKVAAREAIQIKREGSRVTLRRYSTPKKPANVIVPSAMTRAKVPASVDNSPPL